MTGLLSHGNIIIYLFYPSHCHKGGEEEASDGLAPTFIEKPKIIPNESGTLITMKCKCRAKPAPIVTWFKDSAQVNESSRFKMKCIPLESDTYELVLEIKVRRVYNRFSGIIRSTITLVDFSSRILPKLTVDPTNVT